MVKASSLKHVQLDSFADEAGIPFTLNSHTAASYLSMRYPAWAIEATSSIGVSQLFPREFLGDLDSAITQDPTTFRTRSAAWHSQLAEALSRIITDEELMSIVQDICLIPLHDGTWTSARGQVIFFSKSETCLEIPSGIEVLIIDSYAESDPNRRKLFTSLGVKAWEAPEICRLILRIHESSKFDPKTLTVDQLISHAAFLYHASWQPPKTADLWFATMQDERCLGSKLYIPGSIETDSSLARIFSQLQKQYAVIHNDYLDVIALDADWPIWLVSNLGLSMVPRLITPHVDPKPQPTQIFEAHEDVDDNSFDQVISSSTTGQNYTETVAPPVTQNHALQDYQMQLMLLEQQNKKRLLMAPREQQNQAAPVTRNHALEGYQMQLMLLEQQNKKRLLMAQREQQASSQSMISDNSGCISSPSPVATATSPIESSRARSPELQRSQRDKLERSGRLETAGDANGQETPVKITPSALVDDTQKTFALSEEFTFMFRECHSCDVLQLLRDHWHHYSQWIDGGHMKWQNTAFLESSTQLRKDLGACLVETARGSLPLQETVVPLIDSQLDEGCLIPAVNIKDPQHSDWSLLSHFGVVMKQDVHYYLRCLIAISEENRPDVDNLAYIYERIQARYKGNEDLIRYVSLGVVNCLNTDNIRAAFHERDIILVKSKSGRSTKPAGWTNMKECLSRDITVESEYPSSSYLFRCLRSPSGDPIAPIVATATLITSSSKLEDISRLFRDISSALKDVNTSKAAQLLRPLQERPIFPITKAPGKRRYDDLLNVHDTSWFIADRPLIRESFHGKIPLLAVPIEDLPALENLFRALRLDGRMLSKLATSRTHPQGQVTTHWAYTASLRAKSPFIKA